MSYRSVICFTDVESYRNTKRT